MFNASLLLAGDLLLDCLERWRKGRVVDLVLAQCECAFRARLAIAPLLLLSTVEPVPLAVRLEHVPRFPEFTALVARYFPFVFLLCCLFWGEEAWLLQGVLEGFLHFPVGVSLHVGFLAVRADPTTRSQSFPRRVDTTSTGWGR